MNRTDVERYKALYRSLYQARLDLDVLSSCPRGHLLSDGFFSNGNQVEEVMVNVNVTPKGRVTCRYCAAERAGQLYRDRKEGKRDGESAQ